MRGPALQQAVGEAAGGGAHVEGVAPDDVQPEGVEGVGELHPAPGHEARPVVDRQGDVVGHELARLGGALAVLAEAHLAGHDGRGGARPRAEEPALRQQGVEADLGGHEAGQASGPCRR